MMVTTWTHITHALGFITIFVHNPDRSHWSTEACVQIPSGHNLGHSNKNSSVIYHINSDFIGYLDNRKSATEYCIQFGNGAFSWKSKLQEWITTSTTKVEYVVASDTTMLAGQKKKDNWEGGVGSDNINRNIIIIRRDESGIVVPIRIRTDSVDGCLSAPIVTLPDAYKRIR